MPGSPLRPLPRPIVRLPSRGQPWSLRTRALLVLAGVVAVAAGFATATCS